MNDDHIASIPETLDALRQGRMVILVDDPDRENEGDIAMLAEHVTPEAINFMATEARGLICMPMTESDCRRLALDPQAPHNSNPLGTAFTVSINARDSRGNGISASDRAHTVRRAADPSSTPADFTRPGFIFPLRAREGGVLVRGGQTEGMVDLARLAGSHPSGVICEIMNTDGSMARMPELVEFATRHDMLICTIESLIAYRRKTEQLVEPVDGPIQLPTDFGPFRAHLFRSVVDGEEHIALSKGLGPEDARGNYPAIAGVVHGRVHSECLTGDVFGSLRCDCGPQLKKALSLLAEKDHAVLVYMRQEGRGIGLANKLRAYRLQEAGMDTVEANHALGFPDDVREYGIAAQIMHFLGVRKLSLLTNNPRKLHGLTGYGIDLVAQEGLEVTANEQNIRYLETKRDKLGHRINPQR